MAEFLMLKKAHWATIDNVGINFSIAKYNARQMPGDITNVKPDGYYRVEALGQGLHGWNRNTWNLIRIKGLDDKLVQNFNTSILDISDPQKTIVKRKWRFHVPTWVDLKWVKNTVTISGVQVEECYIDINRLNQFPVVEKVVL